MRYKNQSFTGDKRAVLKTYGYSGSNKAQDICLLHVRCTSALVCWLWDDAWWSIAV